METSDIAMGVRCGIKLVQDGLQPGNRYAETQSMLTDEEMRLFNRLREGEPCVVCGGKGTRSVGVCICKFVKETKSGTLFWKKNTHYYVKRSVSVPLCSKHYHKTRFSQIISKIMRCVVYLIWFLIASMISYSMLLLKQRGYCNCIMPYDDFWTVILWFLPGLVGFGVLFMPLLDFLDNKCENFENVRKYGSLKRLLELQWINFYNKQLKEAKLRGEL